MIAIVGGSGSGKSWLAEKLQAALAPHAVRLSLDDFYLDRSHLPSTRRARLNFDHPRAVDWRELERVLDALRSGARAPVPVYDFKTHSRLARSKVVKPARFVLVDGLWLLRRRTVRRLFTLGIFVDCSARLRLRRRLERDGRSRGRSRSSVLRQFRTTVEPMHARYVAPQVRQADVVVPGTSGTPQIRRLAGRIRRLGTDAAPRWGGKKTSAARGSRVPERQE